MQEYNFEWAELLSICKYKGGMRAPDYAFTVDLIREVCNHSFDIGSNAKCRISKRLMAVFQIKPLLWDYLYHV